jgi:hypothetical protein
MFFDNLDDGIDLIDSVYVIYVNYFVAKLLRANGGCLGIKRR